jgi:hypothetical protein
MTRIERVTSPLPRECSTTELHGLNSRTPRPDDPRPAVRPVRWTGAGEGNRTLVVSLEGFCSTIELHPPDITIHPTSRLHRHRPKFGGGGWIRTNVGARPTDLQSAPFSRSGTPPCGTGNFDRIPLVSQAILSISRLTAQTSRLERARASGAMPTGTAVIANFRGAIAQERDGRPPSCRRKPACQD